MSRFSTLAALAAFLSPALWDGAARAQAPSPLAPALDLAPLQKALAPLAGHALLQSRSRLQVTGSQQGVSFTFREQADVLAKRPGKFRAALTQFAADGTPERRLLVICDGSRVWTVRPGTRQYCSATAGAFHAANDDMTALGLAQGGFFLGEGHEMAQGFCALSQDSGPQAVKLLEAMGIRLTVRPDPSGGEGDLVYRMAMDRQGITYRFFVDPATARLRRIELAGRQGGIALRFVETVQAMAARATVAKTTFKFVPPPGLRRVPALSVDPF